MLLPIRDFLQKEKIASLQHLARVFHVDEQALQPMLDVWINKRVIELLTEKVGCRSACYRCNSSAKIFYRYIG